MKGKSRERPWEKALSKSPSDLLASFGDYERLRRNLEATAEQLQASKAATKSDFWSKLLIAAGNAPSPDAAMNNLERYLASEDAPQHFESLNNATRSQLLFIFGASEFLSAILIRRPDLAPWLFAPNQIGQHRTLEDYEAECEQATTSDRSQSASESSTASTKSMPSHFQIAADPQQFKNALCRLKRRELLRIGARDLLGQANEEETTREISSLAQSIIARAAAIAYTQTALRYGEPVAEASSPPRIAGMCVIGMGKLGGAELNFSSDIDLIFIYDAEGDTTGIESPHGRKGVETNHVFFTRMGETLIRFLGEAREEGNLFRVDMRLRPEGKTGPLVRSLESFVNYLVEQGRDWERLAYLKARVLSGPTAIAEGIYRFVNEFVFAEVAPVRLVAEIEHLKTMIDREVMTSEVYRREVKRGYGGIREIEFVIAAKQILYGRTHRALHVRNIFVAIQRLEQVGLLSPEDAQFYLRAYEFLRKVEHRLQMAEERQTHTIPADGEGLRLLARASGFASPGEFMREYEETTNAVHERFVAFFEFDASSLDRISSDLLLVLDRDSPQPEADDALARLGLPDSGSLRLIRDLAYGTREVFVSADGQRFFEQMLPSLVRMISLAPQPARVLPHLHSFVLQVKGITYYYELIATHPDLQKLLVELFGSSDYFSESLIAHPQFFDALISSRILYQQRDVATILRDFTTAIQASRKLDRQLVLLRRAAKFEMLLCALQYLLKLQLLPQVLGQISAVADAAVAAGLQLACATVAEKLSRPEMEALLRQCAEKSFAIIALGKYGGSEVGFFGDLDVVFVYDSTKFPPPPPEMAWSDLLGRLTDAFTQVLSATLEEGRVFAVDARLRPHGRAAPLVVGIEQYKIYLQAEADTWELQAFTRARIVAGDPEILETLQMAARSKVFNADELRQQILSMRTKLEENAGTDPDSEFKRSAGGMVDIEFILQYFALLEPGGGLSANYFDILDTDRLAISALDAETLKNGYTFFRTLETACRMVEGSATNALPESPEILTAVARLLNYGDSVELREALSQARESVRAIFNGAMRTGPA